MSSILPQGKPQFFDNNGAPLAGGSVTFYALHTTNYQNTYQDIALTIPNANPVVLDADGRASIWGSGNYTMVVNDSLGNQIYSADTGAPADLNAIQFGILNYAADSSVTANIITLTFTPAFTARTDGQRIWFKAANTVTGATQINDGLGLIPLVNTMGALISGDVIAGDLYEAIYSAASGAYVLQSFSGRLINVQTFSSHGTYTPTTGTNKIFVEVLGAGGGGGGCPSTTSGQGAAAGGGGGGGYTTGWLYSGFSGAAITVGTGGAGTTGTTTGAAGGASSFGTSIVANGGQGGGGGAAGAGAIAGGAGGTIQTAGSQDAIPGEYGWFSQNNASVPLLFSGSGGSSRYGWGGRGIGGTGAGGAGSGYGAGGAGAASANSGSAQTGGNGSGGLVRIYEYSCDLDASLTVSSSGNAIQIAEQSPSFVLAAPYGTPGAPFWRQLAYGDITGLGSIATQAASSVALTGGTVDGITIGGTTPGAGSFTTLAGSFTSTGSTTARTLAARGADFANLPDYILATDADATAGFNRAIATGKSVIVPPGAWTVSGPITLPYAANMSIMGFGVLSEINFSGASAGFVCAPPAGTEMAGRLQFRDMYWTNSNSDSILSVSQTVFGTVPTFSVYMDGIECRNKTGSTTTELITITNISAIVVVNCSFRDSATAGCSLFNVIGASVNNLFNSCTFFGNDATNGGTGLNLNGAGSVSGVGIQGARCVNCMFIANAVGAYADLAGELYITSCMVDQNETAVKIGPDGCNGLRVSDSYLISKATSGTTNAIFDLNGVAKGSISNCTLGTSGAPWIITSGGPSNLVCFNSGNPSILNNDSSTIAVLSQAGGAWTFDASDVNINNAALNMGSPTGPISCPAGFSNNDAVQWLAGTGVPTTTSAVGSMYSRVDGIPGSSLYVSAGGGTWNAVVETSVYDVTPTSGGTVQIPNNVSTFFIRGSGTLASLTIELPTTPIANQDIRIVFQIGVSALTLTAPSGYTVNVPVSGVSVGAGSRIALTLDGTLWC